MRYLILIGLLLVSGLSQAQTAEPVWMTQARDHAERVVALDLFATDEDWDAQEAALESLNRREELRALETLLFRYIVGRHTDRYESLRGDFDRALADRPDAIARGMEKLLNGFERVLLKGDFQTALTELDTIANRPSIPATVRVRALIAAAYLHADNGDDALASSQVSHAYELADQSLLSQFVVVELYDVQAYTLLGVADYSGAIEAMGDALETGLQADMPRTGQADIGNLIWLGIITQEFDFAREMNALYFSFAESPRGKDADQFSAYEYCGLIETASGNSKAALDCFLKAVPYLKEQGERRIFFLKDLVIALIDAGEAEEARAYFRDLKADPRFAGNADLLRDHKEIEAALLNLEGRHAEAFAILDEYIQVERDHMEKEMSDASRELRIQLDREAELAGEQANLLAAQSALQSTIITRQSQLTFLAFTALLVVLLLSLLQFRNARKLRQANAEAIRASEVKSKFLANMSHEIRTPLNGIIGMSQALRSSNLRETQAEMVSSIRDSSELLLHTLNEVLDFSKIEADKLELTLAPVDLRRMLEKSGALYRARAESKDLALTVNLADDLPDWVMADETRVRQILNNLISNAIKFTDQGQVVVSARVEDGDDNDSPVTVLQVSDTGSGIPEADRAGIFAPFQQGSDKGQRRFEGTGLGLAIVSDLSRLMGGRIDLESQVGLGSTFTVRLPLPEPTPEDLAELKPAEPIESPGTSAPLLARGQKVKILAADDHATNRKVLELLLGPIGVDLTFAENGQEAFDLVRAERFDIAILDIRMPGIDGVETLHAIRKYEAGTGRPPLSAIALTANAMREQAATYYEEGFELVIAKPVEAQALYRAIGQAIARRRLGADQTVASE